MPTLGLYPSHDSGAALVDDEGEILAAINEGRLVDEKLFWGFPTESVKAVLSIADLPAHDVDHVAIGGRNIAIGQRQAFDDVPPTKRFMELLSHLPLTGSHSFSRLGRLLFGRRRNDSEFARWLGEVGVDAPFTFYDHHYSHAASAYYTSPFAEDTLIVTADAQGDFQSVGVYTVSADGSLRQEAWTPFYHSLGKYWAYVTYNLGFTPMRHEGKIAGLAAHGDPSVCIDVFRRFIQVDTDTLTLESTIGCWNNPAADRLYRALQGETREDIAAALQQRTEEVLTELVDNAARRFGCSTLALAGGVFANVALNQSLLELDVVDDVYVHPHMGDGGLAVGAAYARWVETQQESGRGVKPRPLRDVYLGTESSDGAIKAALEDADVPYQRPANPDRRTGQLIADGFVVGRFQGRLEYGPRALGNRSILALPTDPTCQEWLNERLDRTEFMPFAPSILEEHADEFLENATAGVHAASFMTITFDVTEYGETVAPGVVHVDGTARPQIVSPEQSPSLHSVLSTCYEERDLPIVLNTSFNSHGMPIVNDPETAVRAYADGMVDALSIGDFIVCGEDRTPSIDVPKSDSLSESATGGDRAVLNRADARKRDTPRMPRREDSKRNTETTSGR